jgi:type 1 fimbria pilin
MKIQNKLRSITNLPKLITSLLKTGDNPKGGFSALLTLVLLALLTSACITPSPPEIDYWAKNKKVTAIALTNGQKIVEIMCATHDYEGIKSIELSFSGGTSNSCTVNSQTASGSYYVQLPNLQTETFAGEWWEKTTAHLKATVVRPTCTVSGQQGIPFGHVITAHCKVQNFGSDPQKNHAEATLPLTVQ